MEAPSLDPRDSFERSPQPPNQPFLAAGPAESGGNPSSANTQSASDVTATDDTSASTADATAAMTATTTDADHTTATDTALGGTTPSTDQPVATETQVTSTQDDNTSTGAGPLATSALPYAATRTASSTSAVQSSGSDAQPAPTSYSPVNASTSALPQLDRAYSGGMSSAAIAAAVVVPLLVLALVLAAFLLLRRRDRTRPRITPGFVPAMKERFGRHAQSAGASVPILTSSTNNAYFTGLDTSSNGSQHGPGEGFYAPRQSEGGTFMEPPPPYKPKSPEPDTQSDSRATPAAVGPSGPPSVREPDDDRQDTTTPFLDSDTPVSPISVTYEGAFPAAERPAVSRQGTQRSITSTLYSDSASVHSARAARMSVGGTQLIGADEAQRAVDPFDDPESPVSSVGGEDTQSLNDGGPSQAVSPIGRLQRPWGR